MTKPFVPHEWTVPMQFDGDGFHMEPLGPEHNERDFEAWTSSIDHIHSTSGFGPSGWPVHMTLASNLADLERHASDFADRGGFTYSILDGGDVIGCLYIYPSASEGHDASVRSWVTESRAEMDVVVWREVFLWIATVWPFKNPEYASRE